MVPKSPMMAVISPRLSRTGKNVSNPQSYPFALRISCCRPTSFQNCFSSFLFKFFTIGRRLITMKGGKNRLSRNRTIVGNCRPHFSTLFFSIRCRTSMNCARGRRMCSRCDGSAGDFPSGRFHHRNRFSTSSIVRSLPLGDRTTPRIRWTVPSFPLPIALIRFHR